MRNVILLGLTSFLNDIASEGIYALLPLYLKDATLVGFIGGIFNGLAYVMKPLGGYIYDRVKSASVIIFGYTLSAFSRLLIPLNPFFAVLDRLGKGIRDAPRDALLSSMKQKGRAFGLHRFFDTAGAVIGILLAWWLLPLGVLKAMMGLALVGLFAPLPLLFLREEIIDRQKDSGKSNLILSFLVGLALVSPSLYIHLHGEKGLILYLIFNIVYALSSLFYSVIPRPFLWITFGGLVASLSHFLSKNPLALIIYGVAWGLIVPSFFTLTGSRKGTKMGITQLSFGTGILISSIVAGELIKIMGGFEPMALFSLLYIPYLHLRVSPIRSSART